MLEINSLTVSYGEIAALRGVTLAVEEGEIVTLIGGNGAGKSTTLRTISGLLRPKGGTILLDGEAISGLAPDRIVSLGVAHVPEGRRVFPELSLEDNLRVGAHLRRDAGVRSDLERVYAMFPHLKDRRRQLAESLSGGEQQMLALGRAIMSRPRVALARRAITRACADGRGGCGARHPLLPQTRASRCYLSSRTPASRSRYRIAGM